MVNPPTPLVLYRIVRSGHTTLFPPSRGAGRFDAPDQTFAVLDTAIERRAAFAESLQQFRPSLAVRAALAELRFEEPTHPPVPLQSWAKDRVLLKLRISRTVRLLDLRQSDGIELVACELGGVLRDAGLTDFDASTLSGPDRAVTQAVAGWAYGEGYDGIMSASRFAPEWTTCAVFDRIRPRVLSRDPIQANDPDLQHVARSFGLRIGGRVVRGRAGSQE